MKIKKMLFICILLISLTSLFFLMACNKPSTNKVMLSSFEEYEEVAAISFANSFGKVELVKDKQHVTDGEKCAKLTVDGSKNKQGKRPLMAIYTGTQYLEKDDFTDVISFELDAYNDSDEVKTIYLQLEVSVIDNSGTVNFNNSAEYPYKLNPKEQTHVVWEFDRNLVSKFINLKATTLVKIIFDQPTDGQDVFYFDNFFVTTTTEAIVEKKVRETGEIESAEKEEYLASWYVTMPLHCPCELSYNTDLDFVKKGNGSIKITTPNVSYVNTPTISHVRNFDIDFSGFNSIVFHVYNANEKDYNILFQTGEKNAISINFSLKANQWNRCEVTFEELKTVKDADGNLIPFDQSKFSSFMLTFYYNEVNTPLTFYIDEIYAVNGDTRPPEMDFSQVNYDTFDIGQSVTIQAPTIQRGSLKNWKIYGPDGNLISEKVENFIPAVSGQYRIEYIAENEFDITIRSVEFYVGFPVIVQNEYGIDSNIAFDYTVPVLETSNSDSLTWKLYSNDNHQQIGDANSSVYHIENGEFYLEYTATNISGSTTCRVYLRQFSNLFNVNDYYPNLYDEENLLIQNGTISIVSSQKEVVYGGKGIKLQGENGSKVVIKSSVLLGYNLKGTLVLNVYNPNSSDEKLLYGQGETTIPARTRKIIYIPVEWLKIWGCTYEQDGAIYLKNFNIETASYSPLIVYDFLLTNSVKTIFPNIGEVEENPITDGITPYEVPMPTNANWAIEVLDKTDNVKVELTDGKFVPTALHDYEFLYSLENVYGTTEHKISVTFSDNRGAKFISKPANAMITPDGTTTIADYANANKPIGTEGATITCTGEIHYYNNTSLSEAYGGGKAGAFDALTSSIKLQNDWIFILNWKISNEYGSESYRQTIYCRTTENTVIPITPENVTLIGAAELVNLSGDSENPVYSIKVTGYAQIIFNNTFSGVNDAANRLTFIAMASNHNENSAKLNVYNMAGNLVVGHESNYTMNDCAVMLMIGATYGNENFFDANEKLSVQVDISNASAEIYIDFFVVGSGVTII